MAKPLFHHRRKLPNAAAAGNGLSFSGKDAYDDVFSGGLKPKLGAAAGAAAAASGFSSRRVAAEDYAEIFGGKSGTRGSSIPVLDLADLDDTNGSDDFRSSDRRMDYSTIFCGGDDVPSAVPAYEDLFNGVKKAKRTEAKARMPTGNRSPLKGSDGFNSENIKSHAHEAPDRILDSGKQFNMSYHKTGERRRDVLNGTTHITQLNAVPGFSYVIDGSARIRETQKDKAMPPIQSEVNHSQSSSDRLQKVKQDKAVSPVKEDKVMPPVQLEVNLSQNASCHLRKAEQDKAMPPVKVEVNNTSFVSSGNSTSDAKFGRRAKWQVPPSMNASEGFVEQKVDRSRDADYSRGKLPNANDVGLQSHFSKEPSPSSSSTGQKERMGQHQPSKFSIFGSKAEASESVSGYATPFSDEELDVNSAAAASVEALKKAIEQAQESIRIAKEKMERKSRSKESLKTTGGSEINFGPEANNTGVNYVKETCRSPKSDVQDSIELDQESGLWDGACVSGFNQKERPATGRQTAEVNCENVEVAEDNGVTLWFTQLLSNGKQKMAALASELVNKKSNILQPIDKDINNVEEIKSAKMTSDCKEKSDGIDGVLQFGNTHAELNFHGKSGELRKNIQDFDSSQCVNEDRPSEILIFAQKDDVTKNSEHLDKEEVGESDPEYCHETFSDVQFEHHKMGKVLPENNLMKVDEKSFEQVAGSKPEDVGDEHDGRGHQVENKKKQEEYCPGVDEDVVNGNEDNESKLATDCVSDGKRTEDDTEEVSEGNDKLESDEQRLAESVDGEEKQILSKEEKVQELVSRKSARPHENEDQDTMGDDDDNNSLNREEEVNEELQDILENPRGHVFEGVYGSSFDADNAYGSANLFNLQETCRSAVDNVGEQASQVGRNLEEKGDLAGLAEESRQKESTKNEAVADNVEITNHLQELDGDAKAEWSVEGASSLAGEDILETSFMDHIHAEVNTVESVMEDVSETSASVPTANTASFDFINMVHESEQSKDSWSDGLGNNGIDQDIIEDEYATEASVVNDPSNSDFSDLNRHTQVHENDRKFALNTENLEGSRHEVCGQNHIEESDKESESSINPDHGNGFVHESGGSAENGNGVGIACEKEIEKDNLEGCQKEQEFVQNEKESESSHFSGEEDIETNSDGKTDQSSENYEENLSRTSLKEVRENRETLRKEVRRKEDVGTREVKKRDIERERDRMAVERAIREARERAFAEAREWAERAAAEKATAEVRQRVMAEAREKLDNLSSAPKVPVDKASIAAARLRTERAAVERATAEARERALEKALSQKTVSETRTQSDRDGGLKHSYSSSDLESFGTNSESAQRRKARLERHQRIMERAAKALAEKNHRDVLAQREQAQRNRLAETLDAEIKRWVNGKEGNLRALLSTLQYILGPGSGWQPISLTEIVTTAAVKKAYRKATLYVHPDKLQQRGASIQQKYICEKVFDLLKAAWNKFNSEER